MKWFELAASHGTSVLPRSALAEMYRDGKGVKKDARTTAKWFQAVLDDSDDDGYFVEEARKPSKRFKNTCVSFAGGGGHSLPYAAPRGRHRVLIQ